jgi:hypothetical protein
LTVTIVAAHKQQAPGTLRNVQSVLAPEFGEGWLEREMGR